MCFIGDCYVPLLHPSLAVLTGRTEIRNFAEAYKVFYQKVPTDGGNYTIDHSAFINLLDREGRYLRLFPALDVERANGADHRAASRRLGGPRQFTHRGLPSVF
ncbi:SCO family protein [Flaviflagellibacter deserti]|uniref:SCO family protein n=1 Tax=Flaviflagellibacter deserti TaxID=2267266 RepID=A0ABV9Z120_9HYPH